MGPRPNLIANANGGGLFSFSMQKSALKVLKRGILHTFWTNKGGWSTPEYATARGHNLKSEVLGLGFGACKSSKMASARGQHYFLTC